jgi:Cu-Zn family superoxide dismutase
MMSTRLLTVLSTCASLAMLAGCGNLAQRAHDVRVTLQPTRGSNTAGELTLSPVAGGIHIKGQVRGLKPGALHGFHVHEKGDCSAPDALSAGGHFNPHGHTHGLRGQGAHHAGDLPSLQGNAQGLAEVNIVALGLSLGTQGDDIRGTALVVHRDPDDGLTQPTGNSGPRIACGVIGAAV